jgi:hypothetical protein
LIDEKHSASSRDQRPSRVRFGWIGLNVSSVLIGLILVPAAVFLAVLQAGSPDLSVVLPLPRSLVVVQRSDLGCGSDTCTISVTVRGPASADIRAVDRQLRDHLQRRKGWHLDRNGRSCRPSGPFAVATTCVELVDQRHTVVVLVSASSMWS